MARRQPPRHRIVITPWPRAGSDADGGRSGESLCYARCAIVAGRRGRSAGGHGGPGARARPIPRRRRAQGAPDRAHGAPRPCGGGGRGAGRDDPAGSALRAASRGRVAPALLPHPWQPHHRLTAASPGEAGGARILVRRRRGARAGPARGRDRSARTPGRGHRGRGAPGEDRHGARLAEPPPARGLPAAELRGTRHRAVRGRDGLLGGKRQDALFPRDAGARGGAARMQDMNERMRELERRSRAAVDASVDSTDGAPRSRLARARATAHGGLERRRIAGPAAWVPAGAAAAALAAAILWQREAADPPGVPATTAVAVEDLDIVTGGEDFDLLAEDADFVVWAAAESAGAG